MEVEEFDCEDLVVRPTGPASAADEKRAIETLRSLIPQRGPAIMSAR